MACTKSTVILLSFLFFTACGGGSTTGNGTDTGVSPLPDSGAGTDLVGADNGNTVPPGPQCDAETPCDEGFTCDCKGFCIETPQSLTCTEDKNCGSQNYCDTCLGYCFEKKDICAPCTANNQCNGNGSRCLVFESGDSYCGRGCEGVIGCKDDSHPTSAGFDCIEIDGISQKQCVPLSGSCESPGLCEQDSDCPIFHICNLDIGQCAKGCADDAECPSQTVCSNLRCQAPCDDPSNPCPDGFVCEDGHCNTVGGCLSPYDCPLPETYCDDATQECQPGCQQDFDCKSSKKICVNGSCEDKPCPGNFWCAFGQVCDGQTGQCETADGPYCAVCDPQGDHDAQCTPGGKCISLQDDEGNDLGSFCGPPCGTDPLNPCPKGYQCNELQDENGQPAGAVCLRDCSYDPVAP
ncbi:MAG: hypothetical protein CMH54_10290 [Myxococcales bacterium]|nr:hypothetical protein [Myxococcales bacterium]